MGWVDLNTLYVPKSGGTMTGSLTVPANQTLTCYNDTTAYNVGATLKSLQDSVSQAQSTADAAAKSCKELGGRDYLPDCIYGQAGGHTIGFSWNGTLSVYVDGTLVRTW